MSDLSEDLARVEEFPTLTGVHPMETTGATTDSPIEYSESEDNTELMEQVDMNTRNLKRLEKVIRKGQKNQQEALLTEIKKLSEQLGQIGGEANWNKDIIRQILQDFEDAMHSVLNILEQNIGGSEIPVSLYSAMQEIISKIKELE